MVRKTYAFLGKIERIKLTVQIFKKVNKAVQFSLLFQSQTPIVSFELIYVSALLNSNRKSKMYVAV